MQTPPKRREPTSIHDTLAAFLRDSGLDTKLSQARVFGAWQVALGAELSKRAIPVRFQGGELLVEVESAAHFHELTNFTGERYRVLANKKLGAARITRVVFQLKR